MNSTLAFFCDDGSTSTKLAWFDNGALKTLVIENGFIEQWSNSFTQKAFNYILDEEKYSYSPFDENIVKTTNINYQYRPINTVGIQHALQCSGIKPQKVNLIVTLPITEYYTSDAQINDANIERKIRNVKRKITMQDNAPVFTFAEITVMPESIPAVAPILTPELVGEHDMTLVVDLGGTTLDCGLIRGRFESVVRTTGDAKLGAGAIIKEVQLKLFNSNTPSNYNHTDTLIRNILSGKEWEHKINDKGQISVIKQTLEQAIKKTSRKVIEHIEENYSQFHRIYITGGGAEFIFDELSKRWTSQGVAVQKLNEPQIALVKAISQLSE
ncbi:Plasmid segregation protein ParM [Xenorhabdus mauleonii]|uniref:Plasmid segregation actin-type ATPase ParM n=1 Tax=Xenorhabdus mauleonii TaxID=351675 RepID=A0A1I3V6L5_9GAMM|nr:plasmid segregation protein ParM domain-containing protein [Xenorhabdus mauleonii]PHM37577.1 Plasmid segregation protein ParM [Xenorhabdus mauleonii]SFJ91204.1 plasmid segregation actin-type ATPase ParM [Xenorhabdus mauleonii]